VAVARCGERVSLAPESRPTAFSINHLFSAKTSTSENPACSHIRPCTKSRERKREQKKRWFRNGQKWRTGCEGRISVVKRRHGLNRSRYKEDAGMKRWVGLGVIADNLVNISRVMAKQLSR
jgi:hypothetical protein